MADGWVDRRQVLAGMAGTALLATPALAAPSSPIKFGASEPFSFDLLMAAARAAAAQPYEAPVTPSPEILDRLDYDQHWQISYDERYAVDINGLPLQLFHLGKYARDPVSIHLIENGAAREILYSDELFKMPADSPAHGLGEGVGFAGLRLMRPGNRPDWISFLGASYFRCDGPEGQYGLSARGLAVNTGLAEPEEFPRFSAFWVGRPERDGEDAVIYARLDSPSVTGAYRIGASRTPAGPQHCNIDARLFFRNAVDRLGIAPLTSMFWYSELNRPEGTDWRPEIHDSDGLAIQTGTGERIWRPLRNPRRVTASSFVDEGVQGFGLAQRDRDFSNYQDDGVFYNKRPSTWVTPRNAWGPGAVQLLEIPTNDETFDNIVAYWTPRELPKAGDEMAFDYRLDWVDRDPPPDPVARTYATWSGHGGIAGAERPDGMVKYVIDFEGGALERAGENVDLSVEAGAAQILRPSIRPVVGRNRWRAMFDILAPDHTAVDLRVYLHDRGNALSETWMLLSEK